MSITNGPICSSDESYGDSTSSSSAWLVSTKGDTMRICDNRTPSGPTATGYKGEICWDINYIYICIATNVWKRAAISNLLWV